MTTTGQLVCAHQDMGTTIFVGRDLGPYHGCIPDYNVRRLEIVATLKGVTISNHIFAAIAARGKGYGCGWGNTGLLHPIESSDVEALRAEGEKVVSLRAAAEAKRDADEGAYYKRVGQYLCPLCGSMCYGDCEAANA